MQQIQTHSIAPKADYFHRILLLEAKLGKMDYILLEPELKRERIEPKVSVRIQLLSVEEEFIDISLG